jgi:hypothetical protein
MHAVTVHSSTHKCNGVTVAGAGSFAGVESEVAAAMNLSCTGFLDSCIHAAVLRACKQRCDVQRCLEDNDDSGVSSLAFASTISVARASRTARSSGAPCICKVNHRDANTRRGC